MALRLKAGMELQIVVSPGAGGMGFEVFTRMRATVDGRAHERETSRARAADELQAWVKIAELVQDKLAGLAAEAG